MQFLPKNFFIWGFPAKEMQSTRWLELLSGLKEVKFMHLIGTTPRTKKILISKVVDGRNYLRQKLLIVLSTAAEKLSLALDQCLNVVSIQKM